MANIRGFGDLRPIDNPIIRGDDNNNEERGRWNEFQEPVQVDQLRLA